MTELITAAGEADRPARQFAITPRRFPAFQLRQRAIHTDTEHPGPGSPQNLPHLLAPVRILKEVIDDQMGAEFEMGAPAPVHPREQPAAMRVEHQPQAWAPSVVPLGLAVIDVLPGRPAIKSTTSSNATRAKASAGLPSARCVSRSCRARQKVVLPEELAPLTKIAMAGEGPLGHGSCLACDSKS